jgi:hypothetical protein
MRLIQEYLPDPRNIEIDRVFVTADPITTWQAARHFDGATIPWVRLLFDIRDLPNRLAGKPAPMDKRIGVDQIKENDKGFHVLAERKGCEVVIGAIGQFWHLEIPFKDVPNDRFSLFKEPGWGKLSWAIRVEPFRNGSTVAFELRTTATDDESWKKLERYYALIGIGSKPIRRSVMHHLEAQLGRLDVERSTLPGDEILPDAHYSLDHSTVMEAPQKTVWRYLMQLGCDRGGWYSYDRLDHAGVPSTPELVPEWSDRKVGERIPASPSGDDFFQIHALEEERLLVIGGTAERLGGKFPMTWSYVLEPVGEDACILFTRVRFKGEPVLTEWFFGNVVYPSVHGFMQREQLRNIKRLAEAHAISCRNALVDQLETIQLP